MALKPKLQMQKSYDVAALTTNSMAERPIKGDKTPARTMRADAGAKKNKKEEKSAALAELRKALGEKGEEEIEPDDVSMSEWEDSFCESMDMFRQLISASRD